MTQVRRSAMPTGNDPTVQRRRLRTELRRAREAAGFTQRGVAEEMDWSLSKLIRIESGSVGISTTDLKALLAHYHVTDPRRVAELVAVGRAAKERAWWSAYREVTRREFLDFLGYEASAATIRTFEPLLVPGLLQTEEYAQVSLSVLGVSRVEQLVELRMERQERLFSRADPPNMFFILDDAVIHRAVGGPTLMRNQLRHIRDMMDHPNVSVRVVPFDAGLYPRIRGPYVLFEFPGDDDEDALYLEDTQGQMLIRRDAAETAAYLEAFWQLEQLAPVTRAAPLIEAATARFTHYSEATDEGPAA